MKLRSNCTKFNPCLALVALCTFAPIALAQRQGQPTAPPRPTRHVAQITGPSEALQAAIAAAATLKVYFTPVPAPGTVQYPPGVSINGQTMTAENGGFVSFWNHQIESWDPDHDTNPKLRTFNIKVDGAGFFGMNADPPNAGCDLVYPYNTEPCPSLNNAGHAVCAGKFEQGSRCVADGPGGSNCCGWTWFNRTRSDWALLSAEPSVTCGGNPDHSPTGPLMGCVTDPAKEVADGGLRYYAGSVALGIPACARGRYIMNFSADETFFNDEQDPAQDIPIAQLIGGVLDIPIGRCCYNIGLNSFGCLDNVTPGECDAQPGSTDFFEGQTCAGHSCCSINADCNDNDACTIDKCFALDHCENTPKPSWDQARECCNAVNGSEDPIFSPDPYCRIPSCSLGGNRGDLVITQLPEGTACTGDICSTNSACTADGFCRGEEYNGPSCMKNRYVSIDTTGIAESAALRVTIDSLHHPDPPNEVIPSPDFSAFEGSILYVGPSGNFVENETPPTTFAGAQLQCAPHYQDWSALGLLHITGSAVIPSSSYTIDALAPTCAGVEDTCTDILASVTVSTGRWGDVVMPYQQTGPVNVTQPNISDVAAVVNKFKDLAGSPIKARSQLQANAPNPTAPVSISDVASTVDAFKKLPYPFPGPTGCP